MVYVLINDGEPYVYEKKSTAWENFKYVLEQYDVDEDEINDLKEDFEETDSCEYCDELYLMACEFVRI